MTKPEPSPRVGAGCPWGMPRKKGANGLLGPNGLSFSSSSSPLSATGTLLTTVMLTTAGPYFCTMVLKSGNTADGLPVAGTEVTGAAAWAGAAAGVVPTACNTVTGAAI